MFQRVDLGLDVAGGPAVQRSGVPAEHAAVATYAADEIRGSSFGMLAAIQSFGNLAASVVVGLLYTLVSPSFAFGYASAIMVVALVVVASTTRRRAPG